MAKILFEIRFSYIGRIVIYIEWNSRGLYIGLILIPGSNNQVAKSNENGTVLYTFYCNGIDVS